MKSKKETLDKFMGNKGKRRMALAGVLGVFLLVGAGCSNAEPTQQAPGDKTETKVVAEADQKPKVKEDKVELKETPVKIDYSASAEDILSQYTEEGMSRFKLNYPDTFSMEYALKTVGKSMPEIKGKTLADKEFSSKNLKGKPYILNISKTTCPVCEEMAPIVHKFANDNDLPIVSLYPVDKTADVESFFKKNKKADESTVLVADQNKWLKSFAVDKLNIAQVPTLLFVDESGRVSYTYIGKTDDVMIADMKDKAFGREKLYDFVKKDVVKIVNGKVVKEKDVTSEPLQSKTGEKAKAQDAQLDAKAKAKESKEDKKDTKKETE
ncbi:TlpA family protein disulfide reductase [Rossellomorea marisflavi]|uniref:TlpA family protein disulfide reductase n=1 Tax=Rossellomorea marisflavi TaxID=189381 RepID=UPI003FA08E2A